MSLTLQAAAEGRSVLSQERVSAGTEPLCLLLDLSPFSLPSVVNIPILQIMYSCSQNACTNILSFPKEKKKIEKGDFVIGILILFLTER